MYVKISPETRRTFFFFFLCDLTHLDVGPAVAPGRRSLAVMWPLATAARGFRGCMWGVCEVYVRCVWGVSGWEGGHGCQLYLSLVLQLPSCSLWASLSPWLVLTRWSCASLASSSSSSSSRGHSHPPVTPTLFSFYTNKRTCKGANNVQAHQEIPFDSHVT